MNGLRLPIPLDKNRELSVGSTGQFWKHLNDLMMNMESVVRILGCFMNIHEWFMLHHECFKHIHERFMNLHERP